jgi:hypothetical protein
VVLDGFGFRFEGEEEVGGGGHGESGRWAMVWGSATAEWRDPPAAVWECDCAVIRVNGLKTFGLAGNLHCSGRREVPEQDQNTNNQL